MEEILRETDSLLLMAQNSVKISNYIQVKISNINFEIKAECHKLHFNHKDD